MVKTRRSNGENGEVEEGNYAVNDVGSVSDDKNSNWSQRELRSSQYKVTRTIQHWPTKYSRRRRTIKMPRIMFPESDTEPEKYSRRSRRQVRVFFAGDNDSNNRSVKIRRGRGPRKNYMEDESEDKPIQQNVRRSCRQRKLLHHNFNESWITNELKVKGYPDLYGFPGCSSSDEFTSGDEGRRNGKPLMPNSTLTNTDEDTQLKRQRRTSARFSNKKTAILNTESDFEDDNNVTVIEKKPPLEPTSDVKPDQNNMEVEDTPKDNVKTEEQNDSIDQNSESNQTPAKSTRRTRRQRKKKDDSQDSPSESSSSEWCSVSAREPRRSTRARNNSQAFVQIAPRETRPRAKTFTITRKKPYSLRERKPKILRRKTIRSQSPSSTSNSSSSSDTDEDLNVSMKNKTKGRQKSKSMDDKTDRALREIQPVEVDGSVRFTSVGGLEEHIKCLREMVLFPLMYPELFQKFKTRPAKGVLFHGPPGTGKTLLARALANECSMVGGKKVAFFMRKGADCLKKWVGESERHLKLLFQQANKMKPSIIFFDEIDALAPVRSVRQEQVHTSVVGTLLAELDGLCDRGEVIVIGATNRLDAVDPALRRAGRFDRELYFPPPRTAGRRDILHIYTQHWTPRISGDTLDHIAHLTHGYGGSDLKALCSEAVLKALRRVYPQVYESDYALLIDAQKVSVLQEDLLSATKSLVSAAARVAPPPSRALPAAAIPLLRDQLTAAGTLLQHTYTNPRNDPSLSGPVLLISGECSETLIAPALLASMEQCTIKEISVATLHETLAFTQEQALISVFSECRRAEGDAVLVLRDVTSLWTALGPATALLLQLWRARAAGPRALLLATCANRHQHLPHSLQNLFPLYKNCVYNVREPTASEVINFLKPVVSEAPLVPPVIENDEPPPPLPRAPPPPPPRESEQDIARRKRKEDYKLRELRIFLRDICRKLASNRRFYKFTKPVDLEEVTDYLDIVKQPMDLETMMTKVDMHKYYCAKEFLDDVDLICANALEYNPDRTSSDKQIRHEACSLRDHAHALIDVEMDSEFEDECRRIANKRRAANTDDPDLPDFIYTAANLRAFDSNASDSKLPDTPQNGDKSEPQSAKRKRRRMNAWSKGLVIKRQKTTPKSMTKEGTSNNTTDEECKENKPVTSTPRPGSSSEDEPLRPHRHYPPEHASHAASPATHSSNTRQADQPERVRRNEHAELVLSTPQHPLDNHVESPTKSTEKTKSSPKKRNSAHEASTGDAERVIINKTELDNIVYKNAKALRNIGLEALLDLHSQLSTAVEAYADKYDRSKLPQELQVIVQRYLQLI